jgi:FtsZ-binding cell division protein ZapB
MVHLDEKIQQLKETYNLTNDEIEELINNNGKISAGSEAWTKINSTIEQTTQRF